MARHYSSMKKGEMYASRGESKSMMRHDAGMIHEDKSAACLLPQGVIEKVWPGGNYSAPTGVVDLFSGVNKRLESDRASLKRNSQSGNFW